MPAIVPAIIPQSLRDLRTQLARVPFAPMVQIDVVDGQLVPDISWPYRGEVPHFDLDRLPKEPVIEVDLMVADPLRAAHDWLAVGASQLVFHLESLTPRMIEEVFTLRDTHHISVGFSCNNDLPVAALTRHVDWIDYVQLMGIAEIGSQGQPFDERVLSRIAALRQEHPELLISIDGSVNKDTLPKLKAAGANRFVAGSAIMAAFNPQAAYEELQKLAD